MYTTHVSNSDWHWESNPSVCGSCSTSDAASSDAKSWCVLLGMVTPGLTEAYRSGLPAKTVSSSSRSTVFSLRYILKYSYAPLFTKPVVGAPSSRTEMAAVDFPVMENSHAPAQTTATLTSQSAQASVSVCSITSRSSAPAAATDDHLCSAAAGPARPPTFAYSFAVPDASASVRLRSACEPATRARYWRVAGPAPASSPACGTPSTSRTGAPPHHTATEYVDGARSASTEM
eukprot:scaffold843_cov108-Isochrysis_galbana.AAC.3